MLDSRQNGEPLLETQGLTKEFRGFVAVKNVSLRVQPGTIHALIGPNGAGKTTCFNLLTKFLTPSAGTIKFKGENITLDNPADVARRGVVRSFQISAVFPHLTVLENVRVALQRKRGNSFDFWRPEQALKDLEPRAHALAEAVGLQDFMVLLGGLGTVFGPVVGAVAIVCVESFFAQFGGWVTVIQGGLFVVCVLAFRRGIIGELARVLRRPL